MIKLTRVSLASNEEYILQDINLELTESKIAIIGANGSGKTSLLRLLNALLTPDVGDVLIDSINTKQNGALIRKKVGLIFQNPDTQIIMPIVEEDLAFGLKNRKLSLAETEERVNSILDYYGLRHLRKQPIHNLSGGEKQLLAICAILITQPNIVLFDEPTSNLDFRNRRKISNIINELQEQTIVVTHDFDLIENFDRVIVLESGKIVCDATPKVAIQYYIDSSS